MFSRIINQQIYNIRFFHKSFLVDFKAVSVFTCIFSKKNVFLPCTLSKPCRKTKFREKIQVKTAYTFFKQSFNYLTDGKGIKDGAQPKLCGCPILLS